MAQSIRHVFQAPNRTEAERFLELSIQAYAERAPHLAQWMEQAIPEGLTVFGRPLRHPRRPRASNALERLSRQIKRRTRVPALFPNEQSLLRLVSTVSMENSEDWETGRFYLSVDTE